MPEYRINEGSMHERFLASRAKIQIIGGGFGNGKTAATCVKVIQIMQDYPGANALIARSTFPKLNDTIKQEFQKWCPPRLISSFPQSKNSDNTAKLSNGGRINFRYIAQQGKQAESTTSNLLSATYDIAAIDQMEDPEIVEKDFYDILGRMRGNSIYRGNDPTMPKSGPRWLILTCNPTANWFYRRIIYPYHRYMATGEILPDLLVERIDGEPVMVDGKPILMMELFEGSTYENKDNLGADFVKSLESIYRGQMKERFLLGKWAAFEGLIYPEFDELIHMQSPEAMQELYEENIYYKGGVDQIEGYDFGIADPSCYLYGYVDASGIVHILDGFHRAEMSVRDQIAEIKRIRVKFGGRDDMILADPSIFRRSNTGAQQIGATTAEIFYDSGKGVRMMRASNDIDSGILKVKAYLQHYDYLRNPYRGDAGSPRMFIASHLEFLRDQYTTYMWDKNKDGSPMDKPKGGRDHAMDTTKYLLTNMPGPAEIKPPVSKIPAYMQWHEINTQVDEKAHRYGR